MPAADLATAVVLMGLSGVVLYDATRLGVGWADEGPRSGFFPFWLGVALLLCCIGIVVQALRRSAQRPFVTRAQLVPVAKVLIPAAGFVFLTDPPGAPDGLGLYVASALYLAVYMRGVGRHAWPTVFAVSVLIPLLTFVIFERWFLVPMPKGPLEAWLGLH
jgi:putative tricarboxylic transport membrane protein